jgi:hypothetical protein
MLALLSLLSAPAFAQDVTPVSVMVVEWKIYAPGLAAPSIEDQVTERVRHCVDQYSVEEFDDLLITVTATKEENVVTIEPEKLASRAVARCSRDQLETPLVGLGRDARGSVTLLVQIGER